MRLFQFLWQTKAISLAMHMYYDKFGRYTVFSRIMAPLLGGLKLIIASLSRIIASPE